MVVLKLYTQPLNAHSLDDVKDLFTSSLLATNRTPDFFVDWKKAEKHAKEIDAELHLFDTLRSSTAIEKDLHALIKRKPSVLQVLPRLIAYRKTCFPVILDFLRKNQTVKELDFAQVSAPTNEREVSEYVRFAREAGIFGIFDRVSNLSDFMFGVEVGMDTNARKNRSGVFLENVLEPTIRRESQPLGYHVYAQKIFGSLPKTLNIPESLLKRKADFLVCSSESLVNIEVNFFSDAGSKPEEIVDSYIHRSDELKAHGLGFIWITDGAFWRNMGSQLQNAFDQMDCVLNIDFVRSGVLKVALQHFLG